MTSSDDAISVIMDQWTVQKRVFVVDALLKNESVIAKKWLFRLSFNALRRSVVPSRINLKIRVLSFTNEASVLKLKPTVSPIYAQSRKFSNRACICSANP